MDRLRVAKPSAGIALMLVAGIAAALVPGILPTRAWAAVQCALLSAETGIDSDGDGFTDFQECQGITLRNGTPFPSCVNNTSLTRDKCLDPNTKDLFVAFVPAASSLLPLTDPPAPAQPTRFNPFLNSLTAYGITFKGLSTLGITVHQITRAQITPPAPAVFDRTVTASSTQKAVQLTESLDTGGSILGSCTWGTPNNLDGCTVYSQRILNFINTTCAGLSPILPGGGASSIAEMFRAYAIHVSLHEVGHTTGGSTTVYNASYGGNHYQAANAAGTGGKGTRMEQYVTSSTKSGCKFFIPLDFDPSLDPPVVNLK